MSFNIGEVVKLKSGGPLITVTSISISADRPALFNCQWIDKDHRAQSGTYPAEALVRSSEKKAAPSLPTTANTKRGDGGGTGWMR
jgi:uncharacterized protein YodC (DUF2158 family)